MGASGSSSSRAPFLSPQIAGGLTRSLNKKVPYTSRAKPRTCSHLNDSQPRPRETNQMKSVRQVSMVERDVAERVFVTERPKKLKPLVSHVCQPKTRLSEIVRKRQRKSPNRVFAQEWNGTYPMLIMINTELTAIARLWSIWFRPSRMSK